MNASHFAAKYHKQIIQKPYTSLHLGWHDILWACAVGLPSEMAQDARGANRKCAEMIRDSGCRRICQTFVFHYRTSADRLQVIIMPNE